MGECMSAIAIGNGTYHEAPDEGPVDVVLEELGKKRGGRRGIEPLRLVCWGMMCGLTEQEAWLSNPGKLIDLFLWRREYDDEQHQLKRSRGGTDDGGPRLKTTLALDGEKQFKAGMDDAYRAMKVLGSEAKLNTAEFGKKCPEHGRADKQIQDTQRDAGATIQNRRGAG